MRWFIVFILSVAPLAAVETRIKGGRMEMINKGETVLFVDGVQLDRGTDRVQANRMETNKQRDQVKTKGNVRLFRQVSSTETWQGFGESGFYNTQNGTGYLLGEGKKKARIVHTEVLSSTVTRVVHLTADRIDFMREAKKATAKGFVQGDSVDQITGDRYEFWSDVADLDGESNKVTLYGASQPIVIQTAVEGRRRVRGDKIVYFTESHRLSSEGNAEAVFEDERSQKKK
jgi:lipopolysaccharide export system protein LptA